jgi:DNA topoisomerase-3
MSKSLIIAEKPSVAADLAKALGGFKKEGDHFESDSYVISSAVGHLVELCLPADLDVKRGKWSFANLPIIPDEFELKPIEKKTARQGPEQRLKMLLKLARRKDIGELINACDAGREGELIFKNITKYGKINKPVRRLWLQSMTRESIRDGFEHLRANEEMVPLENAAICRSESDWLVGINSTRAMTAFNNKSGGFQLTPVGRVQTPTLAVLAEREEKIHHFKPRPYFEVYADFEVEAGTYRGRWFKQDFSKDGDEDARAERIWARETAEQIKNRCLGKTGIATEERKPATQAAPLLYDLTTLQREANSRFSLSAKRTLQIAQALYERHKVLTYPRTDSRYLPEDNLAQVRKVLSTFQDPTLAGHAEKALKSDWVKLTKRVFNNAKVSDHHAIIPTGTTAHLDDFERRIFDMVARRTVAVFYPPTQFEVTTRITRVEGEPFRTDGKIIIDPGWQAVYGKESSTDEQTLVPIKPNETAAVLEIEIKENETKPPARFTEATLLSAMEGAGKLVEDEELRDAMREKGLGTPATRAAIIEGLLFQEYILRQGKELIATAKGLALITLLRGIGVSELCSPEMTGEWEYKLKLMAKGSMERNEFMKEIKAFTRQIVDKAKNFEGDTISGNFEVLEVKCPKCQGGPYDEDYRTFKCRTCGLVIWKTMAGRLFDRSEVETLLQQGRVGPLDGFRSKMGRKFNAIVKLGEDFKQQFDFEDAKASEPQTIDRATAESLGTCPLCKKGEVFVLDRAYICENTLATPKTCTFRVGKVILQREIPTEQVQKLITVGKTDLLHKFISKKGRPFSAHLKLEGGKVAFEFAKKEAGAKKTGTRKNPRTEAAAA